MKFFKQFKNNQEAFTLIELLLAIFIFTLIVFAVSAIYLSFNNLQLRSKSSQQLLNDSQYVLEIMVRAIKENKIVNYSPDDTWCNNLLATSGGFSFSECIILERDDGQSFAFAVASLNNRELWYILLDCTSDYSSCDPTWNASVENFLIFLSPALNNANVDKLTFSITPTTDPFVSNGPNLQPKVTIKLDTSYYVSRSFIGNKFQNISQSLQTTISSRIYRR